MKDYLNTQIFSIGVYELTLKMLLALAGIYLFTLFLLFLLRKIIIKGSSEERARRTSIYQLVRYMVWVIAITFMMESLGVRVTFILAGSAALLVGVGLGLQQIFNDLVSGLFILYEGTIKSDDIIEVSGMIGKVVRINLRTSVILTRDGVNVIVPNHNLISENVVNWSHSDSFKRFDIDVGVAYDSDIDLVCKILLDVAHSHEDIIRTEGPMRANVRLMHFGDNSIDFRLLFWSQNIFGIENTRSELRFRVIREFRKQGVSIPFPQRDIHIIEKEKSSDNKASYGE